LRVFSNQYSKGTFGGPVTKPLSCNVTGHATFVSVPMARVICALVAACAGTETPKTSAPAATLSELRTNLVLYP
jgi:hypothetical protein